MKKIVSGIVLSASIMIYQFAAAQNEEDVLRYSQVQPGGTARSVGLAGATGALGADFSTASNNPAGIGLFRSNEWMMSPSIIKTKSTSSFLSNKTVANKYRLELDNLGIVFNKKYTIKGKEVTKGWKGYSLAFGYNKLANYNSSVYYKGFNSTSSIGDKYTQDVNGLGIADSALLAFDAFGAGAAYDSWLIDGDFNKPNNYISASAGGKVTQEATINTRGSLNEMNFSFGSNFENRIYLGATLGIPFVNFEKQIFYSEKDDSNSHADFNTFESTTIYKQQGAGINLKLGSIFQLNDYIRLGLALHTPTAFQFSDEGSISMKTERDTSGLHESRPISNNVDYNITSPWRAIASATFLMQKYGLVSVDYEIVDYSAAFIKFRSKNAADISYGNTVNQSIANNFTLGHNLRVGAELKMNNFLVRGGYALNTTPFKNKLSVGYNQTKQSISIGGGYREKLFYIDFVIAKHLYNEINLPYVISSTIANSPTAFIKNSNNYFGATVGLKF
jgi:hypothetical protein